ncbi:hypothetical protein [Chitinimonas naiadis]
MKAEQLLPDTVNEVQMAGMTVRKGSVGAFLANTRILAEPGATPRQREEAAADMDALVPALAALGLFEVFAVRDPELARRVDAVLARGAGDSPSA